MIVKHYLNAAQENFDKPIRDPQTHRKSCRNLCRLSIEIGHDERLSLSSTTGRSPPSGNSIRANEPHKSVRACLYIYTCIYTHNINIYIYIYTCTYNLLLWDKAWSLTDGRKATSDGKAISFRRDETRQLPRVGWNSWHRWREGRDA